MDIKNHLIWYASYGSNINYERFLLYIIGESKDFYGVEISNIGCDDKSLPLKDVLYEFNYPVYFAKPKNRWGGGVAFLDIRKKGHSFGRAYLVTKEQFKSIMIQEGSWYNIEVDLGIYEGYPIKTFTGFHMDIAKPSYSYTQTIKDGLYQLGVNKEMIEKLFN
jgi:hypothetical protein